MATTKNLLGGKNQLSQMRNVSGSANTMSLGEPVAPNISYNPTQRLTNQMKTSNQVMNYAASKEMAAQGRTDMRGNVMGYADTLG